MAKDNLETKVIFTLDDSDLLKSAQKTFDEIARLGKSIKTDNSSINQMKDNLVDLGNTAKETFDTILAKSKVEIPTEGYKRLAKRVDDLKTKNKALQKSYEDLSGQLAVNQAKAKEDPKSQKLVETTQRKMAGLAKDINTNDSKIRQLEGAMKGLTTQGRAFTEGFDLSKVSSELNTLANQLGSIVQPLQRLYEIEQQLNTQDTTIKVDDNGLVDTVVKTTNATEQLSTNFEEAGETLSSLEEGASKLQDTIVKVDVGTLKDELKEMGVEIREEGEHLSNVSQGFENLNLRANVTKMNYAQLVDYTKQLSAAQKEIEKKGQLKERANEYNQITRQLILAKAAASDYLKNIKAMAKAKPAPIKVDLNADVAKMNIAELMRYMQQLKDKKKEIEAAGMPVGKDAEYQQVTDQLIRAQRAANDYKRGLDEVSVSSERTGRSVNYFKKALSALRSIGHTIVNKLRTGFKSLESTVNKVKSAFSKLYSTMRRNSKHHFTNLVKYVLGFRSLFFLVRRLRKQVKEGIDNLVKYKDTISDGVKSNNLMNDAMNDLQTSLLYLKNAWAAAFAPIVIKVMPILTGLIDYLAAAGNAIAKFIAELTGQDTAYNALKVKAQDYADSLDDAGNSASSTAKKQDKLNQSLAEYDKLLVIPSKDDNNNNGSPSGGSGSSSYSPNVQDMFKTITADDNSFASALYNAIENAKFEEAGAMIGKAIKDGLDNIDWDSIKKKIFELGTKLGGFLKGLFNTEGLATSIGKTAGEVVNSISTFIDSILRQTKDIDFGKGLADAVTGFLEATDWNSIKSNIRGVVTQLKDNIKSTIDNFPWKETQYQLNGLTSTISGALTSALSDEEFMKSIGTGIGNAVNTFILAVQGIVQGANSNKVGSGLATALNTGLETIQWSALGKTLGDGFAWIISNAADFLGDIEWDNLGDAIYKFLSNINWKSVISSIVRLIFTAGQTGIDLFTAIGDGVSEGIMSIKPEDLEESIKTLLEQLKPQKVAENLGKIATAIIKSLFATASIIHAVIEAFNNVVDDALTGIGQEIGEKLKKKGKPVTILTVIGELGEMIIFGLYDGILAAIAGVGKWIYDNLVLPIFNAICGKDAFDMHSPSKTAEKWGTWIIDGLFNGLKGFWNTIKSIFDPNNNDSIFGKIKGVFSTKNFENIKSALGTAWATVTGVFTNTWKTISSAFDPDNTNSIIGKLKGIFSTKNLESVKNALSTAWETVTGVFTNTWKAIGDHFAVTKKGSIWQKLQEKFNPKYIKDNLLNGDNGLSKAWSAVTGVFTGTWEKIKGAFEGNDSFIEKIKKAFNSVFKMGTYSSKRKDSDLSFFERLFGYDVSKNGGKKHIAGVMDDLKNILLSPFENLWSAIKEPLNKVISVFYTNFIYRIIDALNYLSDKFTLQVGNNKYSLGIGHIDKPKIPQLAQGAVIPPNKEFLAMLGDQKQGTNIETPLDTMIDAFKIALAEGAGNTNHDPIVLQLDGRVVAQTVWNEEEKKYKQTGFGLAY